MSVEVTNNACSQLSGGIDDAVTSLTIGPEGVFFPQLTPGNWFWGTISSDPVNTGQLPEIVRVTDVTINGGTGDYDLIIERGVALDGAIPQAWSDQSDFQLLVTSELLYDLIQDGLSDSSATSFILNSRSVVGDYVIPVEDNGYFVSALPGQDDVLYTLPLIPATNNIDFRIVIAKQTNTADGSVVIQGTAGQTLNGSATLTLNPQYSTVIIHASPGDINWHVMEIPNFNAIPDDGRIYGVVDGPDWAVVPGEAPNDNRHYVRYNETWVDGVEEAPADGQQYVRQNEAWSVFDNASVIAVPVGGLMPYAGQTAPGGFLWCDGGSYEQATYPDLFSVIGTLYGSTSAVDFLVPDLRGRNVRGVDNMGGNIANNYPGRNTLGSVSGRYSIALTTDELPSHTHTMNKTGNHRHGSKTTSHSNDSGVNRFAESKYPDNSENFYTDYQGNHRHTNNAAGGGVAFDNASPFMDLNYIIRAA